MNFKRIKGIVHTVLLSWVSRNLTEENVSAILNSILEKAKEAASGTENKLDDWIIDFLCSVADSPEKVRVIVEFLRGALGGLYSDSVSCDKYTTLGAELNLHCDGTCCKVSLDDLTQIVKLLREIVPLIIEFFRKEK